jgi:alpha-tubulin suppressor-like RCC1 family protein
MRLRSAVGLACVVPLTVAAACRDNQGPRVVASVVVTPANLTLTRVGATRQLTAEARDSGGGVIRSVAFTWTSMDATKVSVDAAGLVTAVSLGAATVTAATGGVFGAASVTVGPVVAGVSVTPSAVTLRAIGASAQLSATARDSGGAVISGVAFTWTSSDAAKVRVDTGGVVTAVSAGAATVTAAAGGTSAHVTVTVAQVLASVVVTPANPWLPAPGATVQLTAQARDSGGSAIAGAAVAWTSSDSTVVRVSTGGLATAVAYGSATVTATTGGKAGSVTVTVQVLTLTPGASLSAGGHHTCGLSTNGTAYCWGSNASGQLGDGTTTDRAGPVPVLGGLTFVAISAGFSHTCGITADRTSYCWGSNTYGALGGGTGPGTSSATPRAIASGQTWRSISAGYSHTCGVTAGGIGYCWGSNYWGALGIGTYGSTSQSSLVPIVGGLSFQAIRAGQDFSCGLATDGAAYCWGLNLVTQLGTAAVVPSCSHAGPMDRPAGCSTMPLPAAGGIALSALASGVSHSCALTAAGTAFCWGDDHAGQLGTAAAVPGLCSDWTQAVGSCSSAPVRVAGPQSWLAIDAGSYHSCGIATDGAAYCWGYNASGQLGTLADPGSCTVIIGVYSRQQIACYPTPVPVTGALIFRSISAGEDHTCGVTEVGSAYCWGDNTYGQLGDGSTTNRLSPVPVLGGLTFGVPVAPASSGSRPRR